MTNFKRYFAAVLLTAMSVMGVIQANKEAHHPTHHMGKGAKFVFVNVEALLGDIQTDFTKMRDDLQKQFEQEMAPLNKMREDHEAKAADVKDKAAHEAAGQKLANDMQMLVQKFQKQMADAQQAATKQAEKRIADIEKIRVDAGWDMVLPSNVALAYDKSNDVTEYIKSKLGIGMKKTEKAMGDMKKGKEEMKHHGTQKHHGKKAAEAA